MPMFLHSAQVIYKANVFVAFQSIFNLCPSVVFLSSPAKSYVSIENIICHNKTGVNQDWPLWGMNRGFSLELFCAIV